MRMPPGARTRCAKDIPRGDWYQAGFRIDIPLNSVKASSMVSLVLTALLPVFSGLLIGYFAGYRKIIDNKNVASLNIFLMQFLLPITLFVSIARTSRNVIIGHADLVLVLACTLVAAFVPLLVMQTRVFRLALGDAAVQSLTSAFPNFSSI